MNTFDEKLVIGETYELANFVVTIFTGKYKCFDSDKQIIITNMTTVSEVQMSEQLLLEEIFNFTHFYELTARNFQDEYCIGMYYIFTQNFNISIEAISFISNPCTTSYLFVDVVGIVKKRKTLKCITNQRNEEQTILELIINDTV